MPTPGPLDAALTVSARFANIEVAERALLDLCEEAGNGGDDRYWLVTALREALANAIRHGSGERPEVPVRVAIRIDGRRVAIRVEDRGPGFDPAGIPDPTAPEQLLRPSGRGIFYMRQFMDRVDFEAVPGGGTAVVMTRELHAGTRSGDDEE
jgi:serine/threonine-protein kinase RsbW